MLDSFIAYTVQFHVFLESFFPPSTTFPPSNVVDVVLLVTAGMLVCILITIRDIRIIRSYKAENHLIEGDVNIPVKTDPYDLVINEVVITPNKQRVCVTDELSYLRIINALLSDKHPFVYKEIAGSAAYIMKKLGK